MLTRRTLWLGLLLSVVVAPPSWSKAVSLDTVDAGPIGSDVVVRLSVDTDGDALASLDATLTYDDAKLEFLGIHKTALADGFTLLHTEIADPLPDDAPDTIDISLFSGAPLALADGDHEVLWVQFRVLDDSSTTALVLDPGSTEVNEDAATVVVDGAIDPGDADAAFIVPDDASGAPGSLVQVPVIVDPADGLSSFDITLEFNPTVIQAVSVSTTPATASFFLVSTLTTPGRAVISMFDINPVVGSGALEVVRIGFDVVGMIPDETPLDLTVGTTDDGVTTYLDDGLFRICADGDLDGFTSCNDCDDADPDVYPGAPQLCDGLDNDCGVGWPAVPANETDDDGDTYVECDPWVGAVGTFGGDCNDGDSLINPGAAEDCDLIDDDCDGDLDNGTADASCDDANVCTNEACSSGSCVYLASGTCSLSGTVFYYRDSDGDEPSDPEKGVPEVPMTLSGSVSGGPTDTDSSGNYSFAGVFGSVTVSAGAKIDVDNDPAVSAFDASAIAQYVVNPVGNPLTAYQQIAADVSNNTAISSFDAALVAQYGTGLRVPLGTVGPNFPVSNANGSDWRVIPASLMYPAVTGSITDADFVAILYGDVTGNWTTPPPPPAANGAEASDHVPQAITPSAEARLYVSSVPTTLSGSHTFRITLGLSAADGILGMDLVLDGAGHGFEVQEARLVGLASGSELVSHDDGGVFRMALVSVDPLVGSGDFLELTIEADAISPRRLLGALKAEANEGQIPVLIDLGPAQRGLRVGTPSAAPLNILKRAN